LKPIVNGLAGEQWARSRKTGGATVNSEGFRETFLRNGRKTQGAIRPEERRQAEGKSVVPDREDRREDLKFRENK
jgi:hypothetical protein